MADEKPIIKATTPNSNKYDTKIDVYTNDPREDHKSIHIAVNSDDKSGHIIDTTNGSTEHTDIKCYLTTACMQHFAQQFNDKCYELQLLRWFRDNFVSEEDIAHYYETAPIIVSAINQLPNNNVIYSQIYFDIIEYCVKAIEHGQYDIAYKRYKDSILTLEEKYARPVLEHRHVRALQYKLS